MANSTNEDRQERGCDILANYRLTHLPEEDDVAALGDLLADLMHACQGLGLNFAACLTMAEIHFNDETTEEK